MGVEKTKMRRIIIDVQGYQTSEKTFLPKEVAAYDGKKFTHYIFKAPFNFDNLPVKFQKQADWLMKHHHCIPWLEGYTPQYQFENIIRQLTKNVDTIYVKGCEKAIYIRKIVCKPVIELPEHPALERSDPLCFYHSADKCYCALSNVIILYENFMM